MLAQVGRADLLRALSLGRTGTLALDHTDAAWWGYVPPEPDPTLVEASGQTLAWPLRASDPPATSTPGPMRARSALRMPEAWVAERRDSRADDVPPDTSHRPTLLAAAELQPPDEPRAAYQDLLPLPRLARPLAAQLRQPHAAGVNVAALLQASTRRQWPRRLPRLIRQSWPATLVLMLDVSTELFPYRYDMYRVVALLQALVPRAQMRVMAGAHGPFGPWHGLHGQGTHSDADDGMRPQPGCTYLLLSDLGLLRPASDMAQAWSAWLVGAQARQCTCVALAPVGQQDVSATLGARVRLLRWSPDSRLQPERGLPESQIRADSSSDDALRDLLACLSVTVRMDPPLLRTLRQTGSAPQDASLEGRLWAHPDVLSTTYASLRRGRMASQQAASPLLSAARWSALQKACVFHHQHWPLGMRVVEGMHQLTASPQPQAALLDQLRQSLIDLAHSVHSGQGDHNALQANADYVLQRAPHHAQTHLRVALDALAQASGRATGPRQRWCLLQRGEHLYIAPATDTRPPGPGAVLCSDLGQAASGELVRIVQPRRPPQYLPLPAQGMLALPVIAAGAGIVLGGGETQLQRRQRTRGVWGWRQSDKGMIETLDLPWSIDLSFPNEDVVRGFALLPSQKGGEVRVGIDRDEYGIFLELSPLMERGRIFPQDQPLRFRYLPPATYLQGSLQGIGHADEHPQHPVTLSQGLWLAETPCTQALWQAVMGKNPSHFKQGEDAPRRPVENVSWDDVQTFFKKLQPLLPPGCEAVLPTESQWEYACRAGTQTEYWWGDEADDARANWNQQHKGTTPMDRYPPNPWGLYDMHGNIWEWCADGHRDYAAEPARDPEGPGAGDSRVVRGGSWLDRPGRARAACRGWGRRGYAYLSYGFRFALRSPRGPEARPGGLGASRRGGAAGGRTDGADAPAAEPPRRDAHDEGEPA